MVISLIIVSILILVCLCSGLYYSGMQKGHNNGLRAGREHVANQINDAHFWFSGGIGRSPQPQVMNTLFLIQYFIKKNGYFRVDSIRDKIHELGNTPYHKLEPDELEKYLH